MKRENAIVSMVISESVSKNLYKAFKQKVKIAHVNRYSNQFFLINKFTNSPQNMSGTVIR